MTVRDFLKRFEELSEEDLDKEIWLIYDFYNVFGEKPIKHVSLRKYIRDGVIMIDAYGDEKPVGQQIRDIVKDFKK